MQRQPVSERDPGPLGAIKEGMDVYGLEGGHIGKVALVHFGADAQESAGTATPAAPGESRQSLIDMVADVFRADKLPDAVRSRLLQHGFIRVDAAGIMAADRYVMPDQISRVDAAGVYLRVKRDDLVKR